MSKKSFPSEEIAKLKNSLKSEKSKTDKLTQLRDQVNHNEINYFSWRKRSEFSIQIKGN